MSLSVIIPVHNRANDLCHSLKAIAGSGWPPDEIIVVDDASTDGSGDLARRHGARVVRLDGLPRGAAFARNRGAEMAEGDVLVFLDSDVTVHPDTLARVAEHLAKHPEIAALFGSYDAHPTAPGLAAQYKNLLHHYVHQHSRREASTFWSGCGAIRRQVFVNIGGFDEGFDHPSVEDIELGSRLRRAGHRVWLCPDVQVTHRKRWTLVSLLVTDIFKRAVPWTRLIVRQSHLPADLNLDVTSRVGALLAWTTVLLLALGFWWPWMWVGAALALVAVVALNADLYRFFARQRGLRFALGAAALHLLYLLYSSLTFALVVLLEWLRAATAQR